MLKRLTLATILSASLALLYAGDAVREEFHQSYPLAASGRVSVRNVNGAIHVSTWDRGEVKVDAVKTGEDEQALKNAQIVVNAEANAIDVHTKYPEDCHHCHSASVEYTITVPRGASLDQIKTVNGSVTIDGVAGYVNASSVNGNVAVKRAAGDLTLATVNGRVETSFDRLTAKRVSLKTVNGAIALGLPKDAGAHLTASTVHGNIDSDFDLAVRHARFAPGASLDTKIGDGATEIDLRTVNGGITLTRQ
jgi:DUF4097 and DUF4098 domain-containing protein YvlB